MFFRENVKRNIRRIVFFIFIAAGALIQNAAGGTGLFSFKIVYLIPITVSLGVFEKETCGLVYGIIGGAFIDLTSVAPDGLNALYFAFIGCTAGVLTHYIMKRNFISTLIITAASSLVYETLAWLIRVMIPVGDRGCALLLSRFLPAAGVTVLILPVVYIITGLCMKYLRDKENIVIG